MKPFHSERGAAFLYVMLIFVAASLIIGGLLGSGYREVDRTQHFLNETQARYYALGAELYARQQLLGDKPLWSGSQSPFAIDNGTVGMEIEDVRGRFNINSLLGSDQQAAVHFKALSTGLGMTEKIVNTMLAQLESLKPPPPAPGTAPIPPAWMADASELLDHGLPMDDYLKIAPYVTALPLDSYTININTASVPVLLAYLDKPEQLDAIHAMIKASGSVGNEQLLQFQNHDNSLSVDGNACRLHVTVSLNGQSLRLNSALLRVTDQRRIAAIARHWGE